MTGFLLNWFPGIGGASPGATVQSSWVCEGLPGGWALLLFLVLGAATWFGYRFWAPGISRWRRLVLVTLRSLFFAVMVFVLARPVLVLSMEEPVRGALLVILDCSQSMNFEDKRETSEDRRRAAIVTGAPDSPQSPMLSRWKLLQKLAANAEMNLWPRLQKKADLLFYSAGTETKEIGALRPKEKELSLEESAAFFHRLEAGDPSTALGSGLQKVIDEHRGQLISGILLISDGANNSGIPLVQVAGQAARENIPFYAYGVGVSRPRDIIVSELAGLAASRVKERAEFIVKVRGVSLPGEKSTVMLKANGRKVDEKTVEFSSDSIQEVTVGYTPTAVEEVRLEASVAPVANEASAVNNTASAKFRVTDDKTKILLVEQEPRWDFEYLAAALQRERGVSLRAVLLDGDSKLEGDPVFSTTLPGEKEELFENKVIVIGDVDPARLGEAWMKKVVEWVGEMGGGLVLHAGPKFNPRAYRGTPLAGILPVEITPGSPPPERRPAEAMGLNLTPAGAVAPVLKLVDDVDENTAIWRKFSGVRWTAPVDAAKPAAEVLMTRGSKDVPVLAIQNYGSGQVLFVGTDETYRWRSKTGEKYYAQLWGQMLRLMASGQEESGRIRLKVERPQYTAGERVTITGKIFRSGYVPLTDPAVPGKLTIQVASSGDSTQKSDVTLRAIPDRPGEYRAELLAGTPGSYRFATILNPKVAVEWEVSKLNLEQNETAMNETLLRKAATAANGHFVREENLADLPRLVTSNATTTSSVRKIDFAYLPPVLALLLILIVAEWIVRRLAQLK